MCNRVWYLPQRLYSVILIKLYLTTNLSSWLVQIYWYQLYFRMLIYDHNFQYEFYPRWSMFTIRVYNILFPGLLQMMAAAQCHRQVCYFTFGDKPLCDDLSNMHQFLLSTGVTVGKWIWPLTSTPIWILVILPSSLALCNL